MEVISSFLAWLSYEKVLFAVSFLFLLDWLAYLPFCRVAFSQHDEEKKYATQSSTKTAALMVVWLAAILALNFEHQLVRLSAAFILYAVFRRNYIQRRWTSVRRGFGAPGFMSHWTMLYVFLIETSRLIDPTSNLTHWVFTTLKWDFGWIMICAGLYKFLIGYSKQDGMEYGQANPMWGYFWRFFKDFPPANPYFRFQNFMAFAVEFSCGILMLIPSPTTQTIGAFGISLSFLYVAMLIRLGRLAFLMALLPMFFIPAVETTARVMPSYSVAAPPIVIGFVQAVLWSFMALLPFVKAMQYVNLFLNRQFPSPLQSMLGWIAKWVPVTMWRVFTPDVTNFFVRVRTCDAVGKCEEHLINEDRYGLQTWSSFLLKLRGLHVTESIALTSVFTTLRYFPSNRALFDEKLWKYALSLVANRRRKPSHMEFEFVALEKHASKIEFRPIGIFRVDLGNGIVTEDKFVKEYDYSAPSRYSPVRESAQVGTYIPKAEPTMR